MGDAKESGFFHERCLELDAHRQLDAVDIREAAGDGDRGNAGDVGADRVAITEVHGQRVGDLADAKSRFAPAARFRTDSSSSCSSSSSFRAHVL